MTTTTSTAKNDKIKTANEQTGRYLRAQFTFTTNKINAQREERQKAVTQCIAWLGLAWLSVGSWLRHTQLQFVSVRPRCTEKAFPLRALRFRSTRRWLFGNYLKTHTRARNATAMHGNNERLLINCVHSAWRSRGV